MAQLLSVRPLDAHFMKTHLKQLFIIGASSLLLAGCCTRHGVAHWEYKVVASVPAGNANQAAPADWRQDQEKMMNSLAKDGWVFVTETDQTLYFKRLER